MFWWILLVAVVGLLVYIRLVPSDIVVWHKALPARDVGTYPGDGDFTAVIAGADRFAMLDQIIRDTPRTSVLAGDVAAGRVTYVTRSAVMGFPDYTTVQVDGDLLQIHGCLRFGQRDLGVNKARIEGWLAQLGS